MSVRSKPVKPGQSSLPRFPLYSRLGFARLPRALAAIMNVCDKIKFNADGLVPAIVQDQATGRVLMMAWMNRASLESTVATGSGHNQAVKDIAFDCDGDTLLIQVEQVGAACHEGYRSCFFRSVAEGGAGDVVTETQLQTPGEIYAKK